MKPGDFESLLELSRGEAVESVHLGAIAVVDGTGALVAHLGSPHVGVHLRSTPKAFQLLPLLIERLHLPSSAGSGNGRSLDSADLAVMMSSHTGELEHTGRVRSILARWGLGPEDLDCGVHAPMHRGTAERLQGLGAEPDVLHCNCSGKHANMLVVCQHRGWSTSSYLEPAHPLQVWIRAIISAMSGVEEEDIGQAIDGCSAPTFVLPLVGLARLYARLARPSRAPALGGHSVSEQLDTLFEAAVANPHLVAGTDRLDTAVMRAGAGRVMAKIGAAGAYAMAIRPSPRAPEGLGIAIKIADGDLAGQVRPRVVEALLDELSVLAPEADRGGLDELTDRIIRNNRGFAVGEYRAQIAGRLTDAHIEEDEG